MCQCDPRIRTPFCGRGSCKMPKQKVKNPSVKFIVDLYEIRSQMYQPYTPLDSGKPLPVRELHQNNWMNMLIAKLTDKYNVSYQDIEDEITRRNHV